MRVFFFNRKLLRHSALRADEINGGMNVQTCIVEAQRDVDGRERLEVLETGRDLQKDR